MGFVTRIIKSLLLSVCAIIIGNEPVQAQKATWTTHESISKFDDTRTVVIEQRVGKQRLIIQCKEREMNVYVDFGGYYVTSSESNEWGLVTYRVDKQPAVTKRWHGSTNNRALFAREPIATVKEWATGSKLILRTIPVSESAITLEFDLTGLNGALVPVRKACEVWEKRQAEDEERKYRAARDEYRPWWALR